MLFMVRFGPAPALTCYRSLCKVSYYGAATCGEADVGSSPSAQTSGSDHSVCLVEIHHLLVSSGFFVYSTNSYLPFSFQAFGCIKLLPLDINIHRGSSSDSKNEEYFDWLRFFTLFPFIEGKILQNFEDEMQNLKKFKVVFTKPTYLSTV